MRKGDILENIVIESMAAEGNCVARLDNLVLFIKGGAPGDTVDVRLSKIKKSFLEGKVISIKQNSPIRTEPFCRHFGLCGGCSWQHINYATQLQYKQQQVADNLERIGGLSFPAIQPIFPSAKTQYYRNKLDYTFSAQRWLTPEEMEVQKTKPVEERYSEPHPALGYHIPRKYDLVFDVQTCYLQPDPSNAIRLAVRDEAIKNNIPFFDLRKQTGFLRTITIRTTAPPAQTGKAADYFTSSGH